ncbi:OB-fold nucleic acid binding domain-containing protein [Actinospongicola halichondriae]|uniref:OB-fold nucleic acid binding domain-containing protein n=1 Tax=Actinospongicola halichondriae TaxID=3236844 RepID=UPI003D50AB15
MPTKTYRTVKGELTRNPVVREKVIFGTIADTEGNLEIVLFTGSHTHTVVEKLADAKSGETIEVAGYVETGRKGEPQLIINKIKTKADIAKSRKSTTAGYDMEKVFDILNRLQTYSGTVVTNHEHQDDGVTFSVALDHEWHPDGTNIKTGLQPNADVPRAIPMPQDRTIKAFASYARTPSHTLEMLEARRVGRDVHLRGKLLRDDDGEWFIDIRWLSVGRAA